jgi:5-methylcytosine-specific restriction endonuclease McrA
MADLGNRLGEAAGDRPLATGQQNPAATPTTTATVSAAIPPTVAVAVVAHTSRASLANKLAFAVDADKVVFDDGEIGCTADHLRAIGWLMGATRPGGFGVVLEDDAVPVPGFRDQLQAALAVAPADLASLYAGTGHPQYIQSRFRQAVLRAGEANWLVASRLHHGVGYAIRNELIGELIDGIDPRKPIDEAISNWTARHRHRIAYTWPSLVDPPGHRPGDPGAATHTTTQGLARCTTNHMDREGDSPMTWEPGRNCGVRVPARVKAAVIRRDEGQCQLRYPGCAGDGWIVDHKTNIASLGVARAQSYDNMDNLQAVCRPCHDVKTAREAADGRKRQRRKGLRAPERPPGLRW